MYRKMTFGAYYVVVLKWRHLWYLGHFRKAECYLQRMW